jgi:hypothetical protein
MAIEPFRLHETSPGVFTLLLSDLDTYASVFEAKGHIGGGPAWEAVARFVVESSLAEFEDRIEFDSEADTFCALSRDRTALAKLAETLSEATRSPKALRKLIAQVPPSLWDD